MSTPLTMGLCDYKKGQRISIIRYLTLILGPVD